MNLKSYSVPELQKYYAIHGNILIIMCKNILEYNIKNMKFSNPKLTRSNITFIS